MVNVNDNNDQVLNDFRKRVQKAADNKAERSLDKGAKAAALYGFNYKRQPRYLQVAIKRASRQGLVDLKPYFKASPNVQFSKAGQWYMRVPIRRKKSSMSSNLYRQARQIQMDSSGRGTGFLEDLYNTESYSPAVSQLNRNTDDGNLTRIKTRKNSSVYYAFRTVSARSPMNSWILGRQNVAEGTMSKTLIKNIKRIISRSLKEE